MIAVVRLLMVLLAAMAYVFFGGALMGNAQAILDTVNKLCWALLIPVACSGGAALVVISLRNLCDGIERRRMETLNIAAGEDLREDAYGPRVDILSRLMTAEPFIPENSAVGLPEPRAVHAC